MATVDGMTAAAMQALANENVVDGNVNGSGHLILTKRDSSTTDAGSVIGPTGSVGPTGPTGPAGIAPVGSVVMHAASTPPAGWLSCNGAAVSRTTFAALFATIGTLYGVGDGATTFNLPQMAGRFPRCSIALIAQTGGGNSHTHPIVDHDHQIEGGVTPAHAHIGLVSTTAPNLFEERITVPSWSANIQGDGTSVASSAATETTATKVSGFTSNADLVITGATVPDVPPYLNMNFIIKT